MELVQSVDSKHESLRSGKSPKVILLGEKGVGKTSLFQRVRDDASFRDTKSRQISTDCCEKEIYIKGETIQMELHDPPSGIAKNLTRGYFRDSQVVLLVYSADCIESVNSLVNAVEEIKSHAPGAKHFLIRNKIDLEDQSVRVEEVDAIFKNSGYSLAVRLEVSALTGQGIKDLLHKIGHALLGPTNNDNSNNVTDKDSIIRPRANQRSQFQCCH